MPIQEYIAPGEILEIKLQKEFGYAYLKYIDTKLEIMDFMGRFFILLDFYSNKSLDNIEEIEKLKPLVGFFNIGGAIPVKGKYKFKRIGIQSNDNYYDKFIKRNSRWTMDYPFNEKDNWWLKEIPVTYPFIPKYVDLNKIKHLSTGIIYSAKSIHSIVTMIMIRRQGENILDYYTKEDMNIDSWLKFDYRYAKDVVFLENIPEEYWFKPLP